MPGRKPRTNRLLLFAAFLLCVILGGSLTHSSANPEAVGNLRQPEMFVADNTGDSDSDPDFSLSDPEHTGVPKEPEPSDTPAPTKAPKETVNASPEAATGVWTASGSKWLFLTAEGTPYTGWLTDTDGNRYYFNEEGIMQTGWLDIGKKRYYLNLDGILQSGDVTVGGELFHLRKDGSLKGFKPGAPAEEEPEKAAKKDTDKKKTDKKKADKKKTAKKKQIALTFDDGPGSFTGRLLDCLEANNAKATFFMLGTEIESFPDEVKRMAELGFELGNHTYHHKDLSKLSREEIQSEIGSVDALLMELTGMGASVVRPPYGSINEEVTASVGTPMILWSIDTLDWETLDVGQTVDTVMNEVEDGSIILMHDIYKETVDAAEILIPRLIEEGYELLTVHELAAAKGKELNPGIPYGAIN